MLNKLNQFSPCSDALGWMKTQDSPETAWQNCERGDWMLWIAKKLGVDDRKLTMAKYHCAAQVLHLMKDQRSLDAMAACLRYVNGEISREELNAAASYAAYAAASYTSYAAAAASYAAYAAASYTFYAAASYAAASYAARKESLKKSADICRQYLTEGVFIKFNNLK